MRPQQFTYNYAQPEEYHFSLDSVELAYKAALLIEEKKLKDLKVLDLCSGCGVIGFDFHFYQNNLKELHFLEVQKEDYENFYLHNLRKVQQTQKDSLTEFFIHWLSYAEVPKYFPPDSFDLILANPPYFEKDQGKHSPSLFKNRCRFYWDSDFVTLIDSILYLLKPGAFSLVLVRPLTNHKKDLNLILEEKCKSFTKHQVRFEVLDSIRGTQLIQIQKDL